MSEIFNVNRRDFIKTGVAVGGGLMLGFYLPRIGQPAGGAEQSTSPFAPNAFVRIGTDDSVTVIVNHSEMGQGVYTALPMLVAEELDLLAPGGLVPTDVLIKPHTHADGTVHEHPHPPGRKRRKRAA